MKARRIRKRVFDQNKTADGEDKTPVNAPRWTRAGYDGSLKTSIEKYTGRSLTSSSEEENENNKNEEVRDEDEEVYEDDRDENNQEVDDQRDVEDSTEGNLYDQLYIYLSLFLFIIYYYLNFRR